MRSFEWFLDTVRQLQLTFCVHFLKCICHADKTSLQYKKLRILFLQKMLIFPMLTIKITTTKMTQAVMVTTCNFSRFFNIFSSFDFCTGSFGSDQAILFSCISGIITEVPLLCMSPKKWLVYLWRFSWSLQLEHRPIMGQFWNILQYRWILLALFGTLWTFVFFSILWPRFNSKL